MLKPFIIAALVVPAPVMAQTSYLAANQTTKTTVFKGGWRLTNGDDCQLVHSDEIGRSNLVLITDKGASMVALGLILANGAPYPAPVQLTLFARTTVAKQIGRVTFKPVRDPLGNALAAAWPIETLLSQLATANHLYAYGSDHRLVHSVALDGGAEAMAAFRRCIDPAASSTPAPDNPVPGNPAPDRPHVIDMGWIPQSDETGCGLLRMTNQGNEIYLWYARPTGLSLIVHQHDGARFARGMSVALELRPMRMSPDRTQIQAQDKGTKLAAKTDIAGDDPVVVAHISGDVVGKLGSTDWNELLYHVSGPHAFGMDGTMHLDGSDAAMTELLECAAQLGF